MRNTLITYTDRYNLPDMTVSSPLGLAVEDEVLLSSLEGVDLLDFGYRADFLVKDSDIVVRAESLGQLPGYEILEGRLPRNPKEIALDGAMIKEGYKIGDSISFKPEKKQDRYILKNHDFTVVGFVNSPEYLLDTEKGTASIGDGKVDYFAVIVKENFALENYSLARINFSDVRDLHTYSKEYKERMKAHTTEVEELFESRPEIRLEKLRRTGINEIYKGQNEINDAERTLAEAEKELENARIELLKAWDDYRLGKSEFERKINEAYAEITAGQGELMASKVQLDEGFASLQENEKELADSRKELEESRLQLEEAGRLIEAGRVQLDEARRELDLKRSELEGQYAELSKGLEEINRGLDQISEALSRIDSGQAEIDEGFRQIQTGLRQTEEGISAIEQGIAEINNRIPEIEEGLRLVDASLGPVNDAIESINARLADPGLSDEERNSLLAELTELQGRKSVLEAQKSELLTAEAQMEATRSGLEAQKSMLEQTKAELIRSQADLAEKQREAAAMKTELQAKYSELISQKETLTGTVSQIEAGFSELDNARLLLDEQKAELDKKTREYEEGLAALLEGMTRIAEGEEQLRSARAELEEGQAAYEKGLAELEASRAVLEAEERKGRKELRDAYNEILAGEAEFEKGLMEYKGSLPQALEDIREGKKELDKARNQIARLKVPDYTINDKYKEVGFNQYIQNSESMDLLSLLFPVFFFLVALLVSLTTMTRMVDEQRVQIGTLKALGYANFDIILKFLIYGSTASFIGAIIGIVLGQRILMPVVFDAYSVGYFLTEEIPVFPPIYSILSVIISLLCTGFVAFLTTRSSLEENAASLLRPKAPMIGNRIFLERVKPIWRPLPFIYKITARNLFRYKKRGAMTIIGVAGCTALIFTGFGLRDSVGTILNKQYGELFKYDSIVIFDDDAAKEDIDAFNSAIMKDSRISAIYPARFEQGVFKIPGKLDQTVSIIIPENQQEFSKINVLRERGSSRHIDLRDGAVISEKTAYLLELGKGDTFEFEDNDGNTRDIEITGITENYAGHYVYMTPSYYEKIFGEKYRINSYFLLLHDNSKEGASEFSKSMFEKEIVLTTINTNVSSEIIVFLIDSLNIVVIVITLASSMLAMVVLYNLTNINISERIRELSTIMVLGFYSHEVTAYVYRETTVLTSIGILVGYIFGFYLHRFIVTSLPPPAILLDPEVLPMTYVLAAVFTFAFSFIIMLIMHRRLKRINMVEALKAVE